MASKSPLVALAEKILADAKTISTFCEENEHPQRSFARESPNTLLPTTAPRNLLSLQQDLYDAAGQVQLLATDASDFLARQAIQVCLRIFFSRESELHITH